MESARLEASVGASLGEGPVWLGRELLWVDITAHEVHLYDTEARVDRAIQLDQPVGAAVPASDGSILVAIRDGFGRLDPASGVMEMVAFVESDIPDNRMNDGACDSAGRFWAGTQSERLTPGAGRLYRLELDGSVTVVLEGVTISNGLGWSPDDTSFYFIDTATGSLDVFDYDSATGAISDRRVLARIPPEAGGPDGLAVDRDGFIWVALWDGWALRRYAPNGDLDQEVRFPVSHVTSCAFGGPDLRTLYVTIASLEDHGPIAADRRADQPLAGSLFSVRSPVPGLPSTPARVSVRRPPFLMSAR